MKTWQSQQIEDHKTIGCQLYEIHILITSDSTIAEVLPHPYLTSAPNKLFFSEVNCQTLGLFSGSRVRFGSEK